MLVILVGQKVVATEEGSSIVYAINPKPSDTPLIGGNFSFYIGFGTYHLNIQNSFMLSPSSLSIANLQGLLVTAVQETVEEAIIEFEAGTKITIDLRDEAFRGPEAMTLSGSKGHIKIWS